MERPLTPPLRPERASCDQPADTSAFVEQQSAPLVYSWAGGRALVVEGGTERRPGDRRIVRQGIGAARSYGW